MIYVPAGESEFSFNTDTGSVSVLSIEDRNKLAVENSQFGVLSAGMCQWLTAEFLSKNVKNVHSIGDYVDACVMLIFDKLFGLCGWTAEQLIGNGYSLSIKSSHLSAKYVRVGIERFVYDTLDGDLTLVFSISERMCYNAIAKRWKLSNQGRVLKLTEFHIKFEDKGASGIKFEHGMVSRKRVDAALAPVFREVYALFYYLSPYLVGCIKSVESEEVIGHFDDFSYVNNEYKDAAICLVQDFIKKYGEDYKFMSDETEYARERVGSIPYYVLKSDDIPKFRRLKTLGWLLEELQKDRYDGYWLLAYLELNGSLYLRIVDVYREDELDY